MYVYSRTHYSYSSYGLTLKKIDRLQTRLEKKVDRAEEKLQLEKANELDKNIQNKPVRTQSSDSIKSNLLGDFLFKPGGAAPGTFVDILAKGANKGGTGTFLDILGSGDTGGVGMMDVFGSTSGGNLINIVTGITTESIVQPTTVSEQIVDPMTKKIQSIIAMNKLGSALDVKA